MRRSFCFSALALMLLVACSGEPSLEEQCAELQVSAADAWDDIYELQEKVAERLRLGCPATSG